MILAQYFFFLSFLYFTVCKKYIIWNLAAMTRYTRTVVFTFTELQAYYSWQIT